MADPIFGLAFRRMDNEPRPIAGVNLSIIGLIGPAADADPVKYPVNTPVKMYSNDVNMGSALGDAGFLRDAIRGINDQLAVLQRAAIVIIVRTAEGTNADPAIKLQQTIANIVGDSTAATGLWAFTKAPEEVAATPRLLIAPGYTGTLATGVDHITVGTPGSGYDPTDPPSISFTGGGVGIGKILPTAHAVVDEEDGSISIVLDTNGAWLESVPTVVIEAPPTGGVQAVATATIEALANPICASFPAVAGQIVAHCIVESAGSSEANDVAWFETMQSERLIPIVGGYKVQDPVTSNIVTRPAAPRVAGLGVRVDHLQGAPFHSFANQPVFGIVGLGRKMPFGLTYAENEGQQLLAAHLGITVRGEVGSDFAIAESGFVFIGTDNAGGLEIWRMYNQTRGRDYIILSLIPALREYLGRTNITPHTIQAVINTIYFFLRDLKSDFHILGGRVFFTPDANSPEEIRLGTLTVDFAAEEPPVLKKIVTRHSRYRPAIVQMIAQIAAGISLQA